MSRAEKVRHLLEPGGMRSALSTRLSPHNAFIDLNHASSRSLYVAGSQRSGTSWLSEVLAEAYHCRFVLEPLRCDRAVRGAKWFSFGRYLDPEDPAPEVAAFVRKVLEGRLRAVWSDRQNSVRLPRRRLVKDVWQNPLVPWIARRFPEVPIVYILRHPLPSAWSLLRLRWEVNLGPMLSQPALLEGPLAEVSGIVASHAGDEDPLTPHVLTWCIENFVLTRMLRRSRVHVLYYEDLVEHPGRELERVDEYLAHFSSVRWKMRRGDLRSMTRPSFTDYRRTAATSGKSDLLSRWTREVPNQSIDRALGVVEEFGLDRLYGRELRPLVPATSVLSS